MRKIFNFQFSIFNEGGQMLVVLLLVMVVGLTIGLFTLSRTTTDVSITTNIADSTRAFNAAEAGIEDAIRSVSNAQLVQGTPQPLASGINYTLNVSDLGGSTTIYPVTRQDPVKLGDTFTLWLVKHDDVTGAIDVNTSYANNNLHLCFTNNSTVPALGATLYYQETGVATKTAYAVYDPVLLRTANAYSTDSSFSTCPSTVSAGGPYDYSVLVDFTTHFGVDPTNPAFKLLSLRITPLYANTSIGAVPATGQTFQKQGNDIKSTGNAGETARKIDVQKPYLVPAPFLDHVLYTTSGGLSK